MRIVIATPLYPPEPGGPATYAKLLEEGLPQRGIEVDIVKFSDVRHFPKLFRHIAYQSRVGKALKNADAVLALDPVSVGYPSMVAAQKAGKPLFVKVVGDYAWEQGMQRFGITASLDIFVQEQQVPFPVAMLRKMQITVAKAAKHIIVPSSYLKGIVETWGIGSEKISVINNGIQLPHPLPKKEKQGTFFVVSSGRRVPWKGFESIERVVAKHTSDGWKFSIVSDLSREETLGVVKAADVFVLNSTYEGLSHALIEAMMIGTPVIATSAGGNTELLDDTTGVLISPQDDAALERALIEVATNPEAAATRAAAAKVRMEAFTVSRMLDTTTAFLKENV